MPLQRLRDIPWEALRADVAVPAIGRVLEGAAAEREVDRALRKNRELSRDGRTALVEAIFGVALWRRRLDWHAGNPGPAAPERAALLLACLLRDLAGLPEERACALALVLRAPPLVPAPVRLADRLLPHRDDTDGFFAAVWDRR